MAFPQDDSIIPLVVAVLCYPWLALVNIFYQFFPSKARQNHHKYFEEITKQDKTTNIYNEVNSQRFNELFEGDYSNPTVQRRRHIIKRMLQLWSLRIHGKFYQIFTDDLHFDDPLVSYWNKSQFIGGFNTLGALLKSKILGLSNIKSDIKETFFDIKQSQTLEQSLRQHVNTTEINDEDGEEEMEDDNVQNCVVIENYCNAIVIKMSVAWSFNYDLLFFYMPKTMKSQILNSYKKRVPSQLRKVINTTLSRINYLTSIVTHEVMILTLRKVVEAASPSPPLGEDISNSSDSSVDNSRDGAEAETKDTEMADNSSNGETLTKEYVCHIIELWYGKWFLQTKGVSLMTRRINAMITFPACYLIGKLFEIWLQFK